MRNFRKQLKTGPADTISGRLSVSLERRQRKLAAWLNRKTEKASGQDMLFGLIIFCSAFGGYLLYLLLDALGIFN